MALRKMQNPSINLKDDEILVDDEEIIETAVETKEEHKKRFEDRIKKLEAGNEESVDPLEAQLEKAPSVTEFNPPKTAGSSMMPDVKADTDNVLNPLDLTESEAINSEKKSEKSVEPNEPIVEQTSLSPEIAPETAIPLPESISKELPVAQELEPVQKIAPDLIQDSRLDQPQSSAGKIASVQDEIGTGKKLSFPDDFLWGTSTSAYQVEGGNVNDWSMWEKEGKRMLKLMKKKKNPDDFICGAACDSYNRYEEDFDLANKLNNNAIRFGIEWSRVEQKKDIWNVDEIKHYRDMLRAAKQKGFKTVFTLWHWTLPAWLANSGGLVSKDFEKRFVRYVEMVIGELGGDIDYWVTLNEPMIVTINGYMSKRWPPNKRNYFKYKKALKNLVKVHKISYRMIHDRFPDAQVGFSNLTNYIEPKNKWLISDQLVAWFFERKWNKWFIQRTINQVDYIGASYYFHDRVVSYPPFVKNEKKKVTDVGWEIYPEGIYHVLKNLGKYKKPIIILENGLADEQDKYRADFIKDHLRYVHRAISEGVEVLGYFHWSLLDNFEWDLGYAPKFGLYAVDRKTFARTARPSAAVYAKICGENAVDL